MASRYELGPQPIAATIEYNNTSDQVKVKFYINAEEFSFLMSQGNLQRLQHRKGEFIEGLIIDD